MTRAATRTLRSKRSPNRGDRAGGSDGHPSHDLRTRHDLDLVAREHRPRGATRGLRSQRPWFAGAFAWAGCPHRQSSSKKPGGVRRAALSPEQRATITPLESTMSSSRTRASSGRSATNSPSRRAATCRYRIPVRSECSTIDPSVSPLTEPTRTAGYSPNSCARAPPCTRTADAMVTRKDGEASAMAQEVVSPTRGRMASSAQTFSLVDLTDRSDTDFTDAFPSFRDTGDTSIISDFRRSPFGSSSPTWSTPEGDRHAERIKTRTTAR